MAHQYIYTMQNLRRVHPPNKEVLKGIYLSFYPGAKIGVLGRTASGKSTLLRIMAGVDKDFFGEAKPADGMRIGYLSQEPALDPNKNVLRERRGGGGEHQGAAHPVRRGEHEARRGPQAGRDGEAARGAGQAAGRDRGRQRLGPRPHAGDRDGRAPAAAGRRRRHQALGRRAPPRGALPGAARAARPAAARRADQPPGRRERRLARAPPARVPGHDRRRHPRSLLPRQRRRLDPRARSRRGHPLGGQLLVLAGAEAEAAGGRGEGRVRPAADAGPRARVGARLAARAAGQVQGPPRRVRGAAGGGDSRSARTRSRSASRRGRAWATWWSRPTS